MNNDFDQESTEVSKAKKVVDRSAAYPSITIEEAIAFVQSVVKCFPKEGSIINRTDIATVLKKPSPASIQRDVASCAQYGLLGKTEGGYTISQNAKLLNNSFIPEKDKKRIALECFQSPKLYKDLILVFDNHALPSELPYILVKDHSISDKASTEAANIFTENATYCGVLSDGILRVAAQSIPFAEVVEDKPEVIVELSKQQNQQLPPAIQPNQEQEQIKLGKDRNAFISYPDNLSKKELEIIRRHLSIIEYRIIDTGDV
jgi:hypothetical protein